MKKYIKPELFYERYELTQHIADCQWEITSQDKNTCHAIGEENTGFDGEILFVEEIGCILQPEFFEEYCYHSGPDGVMKVFAS